MHIYYDIEATHPDELLGYSEKALFILYKIKGFIIQRFEILEDEMENEWESNKAFVALITPKEKNEQFQIGYPNFSEHLKSKLESCLSEEDYIYLNRLLS